MKPEALEPLLLDRALGELSPPVAALLDEHLARDPSAATRAAGLMETLQLARRSTEGFARSERRSVPDLRWLHSAMSRARWQRNLLGMAQLAACVLLGVVVGWSVRPKNPVPGPVAFRTTPVATSPVDVSAAKSSFWSTTKVLAELRIQAARRESRNHRYNLHWESPLKMPRVEEEP